MCLAERVRIILGGQVIEDSLLHYRLVATLMKLLPPARNWSSSMENLGGGEAAGPGSVFGNGFVPDTIAANGSRHVLTPLHGSGFFASHYLIPLSMFPITIELTLCDPGNVAVYQSNATTYSQQYQITNPRILADVVNVDSSIQAQLSSALLEGRALPLTFNTWNNTYYSVATGPSWSININRGFSRLNTMLLSHTNAATIIQNTAGYTASDAWISWHGAGAYNFTEDTFRLQAAIGPLLFPETPLQSHGECAYQLSKVMAMHSSVEGMSISPFRYKSDEFIVGLDLERMSSSPGAGQAMFTGLNTKTGNDMIRFTWDNVTAQAGWAPDRVWLHLGYQVVVELRAEGVVCLD
jgi:hypothetical protein